jgi:hypothetical protein
MKKLIKVLAVGSAIAFAVAIAPSSFAGERWGFRFGLPLPLPLPIPVPAVLAGPPVVAYGPGPVCYSGPGYCGPAVVGGSFGWGYHGGYAVHPAYRAPAWTGGRGDYGHGGRDGYRH